MASSLDDEREGIDSMIKEAYPDSYPIHARRFAAKRTMIHEDYDLDEVCYFATATRRRVRRWKTFTEHRQAAGGILHRAAEALGAAPEHLQGQGCQDRRRSRSYTDATQTDVFIHHNDGDKERLKTNLEVHISCVRDSGCTDAIKLTKLWRTRNAIGIKTFPLELLVIEVLRRDGSGNCETRFQRVLTAFADDIDNFNIEDPANPSGNDLSQALTDTIRNDLKNRAQHARHRRRAWLGACLRKGRSRT